MFKDEVILKIKAGNGGHGSSQFRKEKYIAKGGPCGGDGGNGGDVYIHLMDNLNSFSHLHNQMSIRAEDGENGKKNQCYGKKGKDTIIPVPDGTIIINEETGDIITTIGKENPSFLLEKGGHGGRGNVHFKNSVLQKPLYSEKGIETEEKIYRLILKIIADIGLIGYPNVGKSSLLQNLSNSKTQVSNYMFTTLKPNLGIFYANGEEWNPIIIADLPGIIKGAFTGKGLGTRFLKHIERNKSLCILLDFSSSIEEILSTLSSLLEEIKQFNQEILIEKKFYIIGTKIDLISKKDCDLKVSKLKKFIDAEKWIKKSQIYGIYPISNINLENLEVLKKVFYKKSTNALY